MVSLRHQPILVGEAKHNFLKVRSGFLINTLKDYFTSISAENFGLFWQYGGITLIAVVLRDPRGDRSRPKADLKISTEIAHPSWQSVSLPRPPAADLTGKVRGARGSDTALRAPPRQG